ncbi:hypothetical protein M9434_002768 [Picochlorum sp. BPE23]|nr:hypothetical protein M9434_002768 [Picochlorum sp. BPE23]
MENERFVGSSAESYLTRANTKCFNEIKGLLQDNPEPVDEVNLPHKHEDVQIKLHPQQLIAPLIANLTKTCGVISTVLSVPTYWNEPMRCLMRDAALIAGLQDVELLDECTAISLAYRFQEQDTFALKEHTFAILFVDVGHLSTQASVVGMSKDKVYVQTSASCKIGGKHFTEALFKTVISKLPNNLEVIISNKDRKRTKLFQECEKAKRKYLGSESSVLHPVHLDLSWLQNDFEINVPISDIEKESKKPLEDVMQTIEDACHGEMEIKYVEILGGGTLLKLLRDQIEKKFPEKVFSRLPARDAVAKGCALWAAMIFSPENVFQSQNFLEKTQVVASLSTDIKLLNGHQDRNLILAMDRGHEIPYEKSLKVSPSEISDYLDLEIRYEEKASVSFEVNKCALSEEDLQQIHSSTVDECRLLVRIDISGIMDLRLKVIKASSNLSENEFVFCYRKESHLQSSLNLEEASQWEQTIQNFQREIESMKKRKSDFEGKIHSTLKELSKSPLHPDAIIRLQKLAKDVEDSNWIEDEIKYSKEYENILNSASETLGPQRDDRDYEGEVSPQKQVNTQQRSEDRYRWEPSDYTSKEPQHDNKACTRKDSTPQKRALTHRRSEDGHKGSPNESVNYTQPDCRDVSRRKKAGNEALRTTDDRSGPLPKSGGRNVKSHPIDQISKQEHDTVTADTHGVADPMQDLKLHDQNDNS